MYKYEGLSIMDYYYCAIGNTLGESSMLAIIFNFWWYYFKFIQNSINDAMDFYHLFRSILGNSLAILTLYSSIWKTCLSSDLWLQLLLLLLLLSYMLVTIWKLIWLLCINIVYAWRYFDYHFRHPILLAPCNR